MADKPEDARGIAEATLSTSGDVPPRRVNLPKPSQRTRLQRILARGGATEAELGGQINPTRLNEIFTSYIKGEGYDIVSSQEELALKLAARDPLVSPVQAKSAAADLWKGRHGAHLPDLKLVLAKTPEALLRAGSKDPFAARTYLLGHEALELSIHKSHPARTLAETLWRRSGSSHGHWKVFEGDLELAAYMGPEVIKATAARHKKEIARALEGLSQYKAKLKKAGYLHSGELEAFREITEDLKSLPEKYRDILFRYGYKGPARGVSGEVDELLGTATAPRPTVSRGAARQPSHNIGWFPSTPDVGYYTGYSSGTSIWSEWQRDKRLRRGDVWWGYQKTEPVEFHLRFGEKVHHLDLKTESGKRQLIKLQEMVAREIGDEVALKQARDSLAGLDFRRKVAEERLAGKVTQKTAVNSTIKKAELELPAALEDHISTAVRNADEGFRIGALRKATPYAIAALIGADVLTARDKTGPAWGAASAAGAYFLTKRVQGWNRLGIIAGAYAVGRMIGGSIGKQHSGTLHGFEEGGEGSVGRKQLTDFGSGRIAGKLLGWLTRHTAPAAKALDAPLVAAARTLDERSLNRLSTIGQNKERLLNYVSAKFRNETNLPARIRGSLDDTIKRLGQGDHSALLESISMEEYSSLRRSGVEIPAAASRRPDPHIFNLSGNASAWKSGLSDPPIMTSFDMLLEKVGQHAKNPSWKVRDDVFRKWQSKLYAERATSHIGVRLERELDVFARAYSGQALYRRGHPMTLEGFRNVGVAGERREGFTGFGTGWDAARDLAISFWGKVGKTLGHGEADDLYKRMIKSDEFQEALLKGKTVGKLGSGGIGTVDVMETEIRGQKFRYARKSYTGKDVNHSMRRLDEETEGLRALEDKISPTVYGKGRAVDDRQTPFMFMELIEEAQTLRSWSQKHGRLPAEQIKVLRDAVEELHSKHLVHTDITGRNVLVDNKGRLVLIDPMPNRYNVAGKSSPVADAFTEIARAQDDLQVEAIASGQLTGKQLQEKLWGYSNAVHLLVSKKAIEENLSAFKPNVRSAAKEIERATGGSLSWIGIKLYDEPAWALDLTRKEKIVAEAVPIQETIPAPRAVPAERSVAQVDQNRALAEATQGNSARKRTTLHQSAVRRAHENNQSPARRSKTMVQWGGRMCGMGLSDTVPFDLLPFSDTLPFR